MFIMINFFIVVSSVILMPNVSLDPDCVLDNTSSTECDRDDDGESGDTGRYVG